MTNSTERRAEGATPVVEAFEQWHEGYDPTPDREQVGLIRESAWRERKRQRRIGWEAACAAPPAPEAKAATPQQLREKIAELQREHGPDALVDIPAPVALALLDRAEGKAPPAPDVAAARETIAKARKVCEGATPGPWEVRQDYYIGRPGKVHSLAEVKCGDVPAEDTEQHKANARLMAVARTLLPVLAGIAAAALAEGERLREALKFYADDKNWDNEYEASDGYRTTKIYMYGEVQRILDGNEHGWERARAALAPPADRQGQEQHRD